MDACVTADRSDSYRWRSRDGAFIPIHRSRHRYLTAIESLQRDAESRACDGARVLPGVQEGKPCGDTCIEKDDVCHRRRDVLVRTASLLSTQSGRGYSAKWSLLTLSL